MNQPANQINQAMTDTIDAFRGNTASESYFPVSVGCA